MKKFLFFAIIIFAVIFTSCKSDGNAGDAMSDENVEELAANILAEELAAAQQMEEETTSDGVVANEVEVKMEDVNVNTEQKKEEKKAILTEQLKESPNLGKDCESILKEYETLVENYLSGKDKDGIIKKLAGWANDPIFNKCKKSPEYKDRFFKLEEKMYADEDEGL